MQTVLNDAAGKLQGVDSAVETRTASNAYSLVDAGRVGILSKSRCVVTNMICVVYRISCMFAYKHIWYQRWDLNPQAVRRRILNPLCIPFHHSGVYDY